MSVTPSYVVLSSLGKSLSVPLHVLLTRSILNELVFSANIIVL